jgi:N-methylhydantoinase A
MRFLGIDVGGTFTDVALMDEDGRLRTYKVPSTPEDPTLGVLDSIKLAATDLGISGKTLLGDLVRLAHGTTVATNAFLEHRGGRIGLITTRGFGDTIVVQRMKGMTAGMLWDEMTRFSRRGYPDPLVPRSLVKEVDERVDSYGEVIVQLQEAGARDALRELAAADVDAIAVCLLWSFRNPAHERRIYELATEEAPGIPVIVSHRAVPVIGEYERTATTVINAYLRGSVAGYVGGLQQRLSEAGLRGPLAIMNSAGGVVRGEMAVEDPVSLFLSGPTGGVVASRYLSEELGFRNVITTDMGGTSFDVGLIIDGRIVLSNVSEIGKYHAASPMVEVQAIGAGGGSIARVHERQLAVGPQSAGARPGPACYGHGGAHPTVTDADLVLGLLNPDYFLGGQVKLRRDLASAAIEEHVARPLGLMIDEAAGAIRTIVDSKMADLLHAVTFGKGHDPRDFVLLAYGGAGPTHCASYGRELGPAKIVVPFTASVHSAYGGLASDIHAVFELSDPMRTPPFADQPASALDASAIEAIFQTLERQGAEALRATGIADDAMVFPRSVDMRYRRQTNHLAVPVPATMNGMGKQDLTDLLIRFEQIYGQTYGSQAAFPEAGFELTTFRVEAVGSTPKPRMQRMTQGDPNAAAARRGSRSIYLWRRGARQAVSVYEGPGLRAGHVLSGPCVVDYPTTTVFIDDDQEGRVDGLLDLVIQPAG